MLLSGNPIDGFGVPTRERDVQEHPRGLGLGVATNLFQNTVAQMPSAAAPGTPSAAPNQTTASAASRAVQANEATGTPASSSQKLANPGDAASWNNVCTSDGRLVFMNGAWHVSSVEDVTCLDTLSESAKDIITTWKGYPTYVGPFPVDFVANPNGQITNLTDPAQIGPKWAAWLGQQMLQQEYTVLQLPPCCGTKFQSGASAAGCVAGNAASTNCFTEGHAVNPIPLVVTLPPVIGAMQVLQWDGTPIPSTFGPPTANPPGQFSGLDNETILTAVTAVLSQLENQTLSPGPALSPGNIWPVQTSYGAPVASSLASGGHALVPRKAWAQKDANGYIKTSVQYDQDPWTYSYYSLGAWRTALAPWAKPGDITAPLLQTGPNNAPLTPKQLSNFDAMKLGPLPIAKFKNPITGANWGLWVLLSPTGPEAEWNTSLDAPNGAVMQVAVAPIPQESFWDQVMDVINWLPTELGGDVLWTLSAWMSAFTCDLAGQQAMLNNPALKSNPYSMAVAVGALAVANSAQCGGPPVDCSIITVNPPAQCCSPTAQSPACPPVLPVTVTPWYLQWWVLAAAGVGIFLLFKKKPEESEAAPSAAVAGLRGTRRRR